MRLCVYYFTVSRHQTVWQHVSRGGGHSQCTQLGSSISSTVWRQAVGCSRSCLWCWHWSGRFLWARTTTSLWVVVARFDIMLCFRTCLLFLVAVANSGWNTFILPVSTTREEGTRERNEKETIYLTSNWFYFVEQALGVVFVTSSSKSSDRRFKHCCSSSTCSSYG